MYVIYIYLKKEWKDKYLSWDPVQYNGTSRTINIDPENIWFPDILLQNRLVFGNYVHV